MDRRWIEREMRLLFWLEYVVCFVAVAVDIVDVVIPFVTNMLPVSVIDPVMEYLWDNVLKGVSTFH